jgi:hypothetical protein
MKNDLIIVPTCINPDKLLRFYNKRQEVLALSPSAMLALDMVNIPYKTTEDFYDTEVFRTELRRLHEKTEAVFFELDDICENFVSFPYAYSGNIIYFLKMFANLFYLEHICRKINEAYSKIYLFSDTPVKRLFWGNLTYLDLRSIPQTTGFENKIQVFRNLLPIEEISQGAQSYPAVPYRLKIGAALKMYPERLKKGIKEKRFPFLTPDHMLDLAGVKRTALCVIQDGHEVGFLRKHMPGFKFVNPAVSLRKTIPSLACSNYDFDPVKTKLQSFLETNFPRTRLLIEQLFLSYHREVVGRISLFKESFEQSINENRPKVLLSAVGTRDVIDSVFSFVANKQDIPVMYFQHGGPCFTNNIFQKYVERDFRVKKTLILNAKAEKEQAEHDGSRCLSFGSIMRYQLMGNRRNNSSDKALYCCGPFPFYNYTSLLFNGTDKYYYQINRDIVKAFKRKFLHIDIKLHPIKEDYCFNYFRQLLSALKYSKANIIYGINAESIMKSYGLMIFDFIGTAIFPFAMSLKVPIILYLKDIDVVSPFVLEDLKTRCYIVRDRKELGEILGKYAAGNLPSKWSLDIIDRYVYPIKKGHPGPHIANYIKSVCSGDKLALTPTV